MNVKILVFPETQTPIKAWKIWTSNQFQLIAFLNISLIKAAAQLRKVKGSREIGGQKMG